MDAGVPSSLNGGVPSAPDGGVSSALDGWVPSAWMVESPLPGVRGVLCPGWRGSLWVAGSPLHGWQGPLCPGWWGVLCSRWRGISAGGRVPSAWMAGSHLPWVRGPSALDGGGLCGWPGPSAWMEGSPLPWVVGGPLPRIAGLSAGGRAPLPEGEGTPRAHSCQGGRCNPAPPHPGVTEAASGPAAPSRQTCPFHPQREGLRSRDSVLMDSPSDDKPAPLAWKLPSPSV